MKAINAFIIILLLVMGSAGSLAAAETTPLAETAIADIGEQLRAEIRDLTTRFKGISQANTAIKAAGLSYQKALTADPAKADDYITETQQAMMAGVYTFDATYAALFLRKKELAEALKARRTLGEALGFSMAMPPELKELVTNPEKLDNFDRFAEVADKHFQGLMAEQMTTDERMIIMAKGAYGAVVQGLYVVTESIAQAGYPEEMVDLMDQQLTRINFMIHLLNVFRGEESFASAVAMEPRLKALASVKGLIEARGSETQKAEDTGDRPPFFIEITQKEVDMIRDITAPLRRDILNGKG